MITSIITHRFADAGRAKIDCICGVSKAVDGFWTLRPSGKIIGNTERG